MTRYLLTAAALLAGFAATAAPVPKLPPPPAPKASANLTLGVGKVAGETVEVNNTVTTYQTQFVARNQVVNGQNVVIQEAVATPIQQSVTYRYAMAGTKATTADGKELDADALAKKLGDGGAVVIASGALDPEWRKLFADDVVFLEMTNAGRVGVAGGGVIRLLAPPVAPPPIIK